MKKNFLSNTPQPIRLHVPDYRRVSVTLVGCGGTGSHIASGLVALQAALADRDIAMDALLIDGDVVEQKNVGRQLFALGDIGKPKAQVIGERLNAAFGCRFGSLNLALTDGYTIPYTDGTLDVVIGAVDNTAARAIIANAVKNANGKLWWLDCGNANHSGQVALGNIAEAKGLRGAVALGMIDRLPAPSLVFPDLVKTPPSNSPRSQRRRTGGEQTRAPSCAELTASGDQSLMVNRVIAAYALELLYAFLVESDPQWCALSFDLRYGGTKPYLLDVPTLAQVTMLKSDQLVAKGKAK